jgi:catechol 2,3-dioxygenase-like lactoylglutathione lyase family enzyme
MTQGQRSMPILQSTDVDASVDFYTVGLGFTLGGKWKEDDGETTFAIVQLDNITLGLQRADAVTEGANWAAYLYVADIAAYRDQIQANAVRLNRDLETKFYGCQDLDVRDPDGNILCFGQDMSPGKNGPGL